MYVIITGVLTKHRTQLYQFRRTLHRRDRRKTSHS